MSQINSAKKHYELSNLENANTPKRLNSMDIALEITTTKTPTALDTLKRELDLQKCINSLKLELKNLLIG